MNKEIHNYINAIKDNFIEPMAIKKGDKSVLLNGCPIKVNFRIISEDNYQLLLFLLKTYGKKNE